MSANLIDLFRNTVSDLLVKQSSEILSESAESTGTAIEAILPSLMVAVIQKCGSPAGTRSLMDYLIDNKITGSFLNDASNLLSSGPATTGLMSDGAGILKYLLGDKLSAAVDIISASSGLRTSSSMSLLKLTSPFFLDVLGKYINEKGLDEQGIKILVQGHRESAVAALPKNMDQLLGLTSNAAQGQGSTGANAVSSSTQTEKNNRSKFLPWVILLITSLGLFYFVQKGCGSKETGNNTDALTKPESSQNNDSGLHSFNLPGGIILKASKQSFTGLLAQYLTTPGDVGKCFTFDRVDFESGTSRLTASSDAQLNQLLTLLKTYETVKVNVVAYTENVGDDAQNKELSKDRAKAVKTWLSEHYIAPGRIDTQGMGEENPVAPNDTQAGRNKNRRVELCVTKK